MRQYDYLKFCPIQIGQFRLLKLLPGYGHDDLECNLTSHFLPPHLGSGADSETPPKYQALSYHWGSEQPTLFIRVLVASGAFVIFIRPNLAAALRQLRSPAEEKYFWIDALCIEQENEEEKSAQIHRMAQIYNGAEEVCVWLGVEKDDSGKAMNFIKRCLGLDLDDFDRLVKDSLASQEWAALSRLMRRAWFSRRWIIQEIALARAATLHCGAHSVPWGDFADVISLFASEQHQIRRLLKESTLVGNHPDYLGDLTELGAIRLVQAADNLFRKSEDGQIMERLLSLEALMSSLSAFEAATPHDIIYAVLWLASDARPSLSKRNPSELNPNDPFSPEPYSPSLTLSPASFLPSRHRGSSVSEVLTRVPEGFLIQRGRADSRVTGSRPAIMIQPPQAPPDIDQGASNEENLPSDLQPRRTNSDQFSSGSETAATQGLAANPSSRSPSADGTGRRNDDPFQFLSNTLHINTSSSSSRRNTLLHTDVVENQDKRLKIAGKQFITAIEKMRFKVDYKKTVFEVCKDFLAFTIARSNSLDMICRPWAPDVDDLPSWIPRLNGSAFGLDATGAYRRVNADPLVGKPGVGSKNYRAAKTSRAHWRPTGKRDQSLLVKGFELDTIKEKKSPAIGGTVPSEWLAAGGWNDINTYPPDHFWRTLVGNRDAHGQRPPSHWKRVCRDVFRRKPARGDLSTGEVIMYGSSTIIREYLERVQCMVWSRRLVILKSLPSRYSLGLAPSKTKKGDIVCILDGCSVPVLLRKHKRKPTEQDGKGPVGSETTTNGAYASNSGPVGKEEDYYEFIGECYVHGMMDGEAFQVKIDKKIEEKDFILK